MADFGGLGQEFGDIKQYLEGVKFPINKDELIQQVQQNGAPQELIQKLEESAKASFPSAGAVLKELGVPAM